MRRTLTQRVHEECTEGQMSHETLHSQLWSQPLGPALWVPHLLLGALRPSRSCAARSAQQAKTSSSVMPAHVTRWPPRYTYQSHRHMQSHRCSTTTFSWTTVGYPATFQTHAQACIHMCTQPHMYPHMHGHTNTVMHRREAPRRVVADKEAPGAAT